MVLAVGQLVDKQALKAELALEENVRGNEDISKRIMAEI